MDRMFNAVAGVDVHKDQITITTLVYGKGKTVRETFESRTYTEDLKNAGKRILEKGIKHVAMESTGVYWVPIYNVWNAMGLVVTLGNATHIKNVPGRKTDAKDSDWIAQLHQNGLIRPSYIPDDEFRQLRLLTRHRRKLIEDMARIKNRIQKILEDGNVKLASVLSNVFGKSGMAIIEAIASGVDDPVELSLLANERLKKSKEELRKSLNHTLTEDHRYLLGNMIIQLKHTESMYNDIDQRVDKKISDKERIIEQLTSIPGVERKLAQDILSESTTNMDVFKSDRHFAAWAGVAPGSHESASKKKE